MSADAPASDGKLAARALAGQQDGFNELFKRHREAVYRLCRAATGDADEALDLTQESFVAAFGALARYDPARPFRAWVARIALNKCRDWRRRRAVRRFLNFDAPQDGHEVAADLVPADVAADDRQMLARIAAAIATLPAKQQEVLLLRTVEGMTEADVAATLGISQKAVEARLYRARQTLIALRCIIS